MRRRIQSVMNLPYDAEVEYLKSSANGGQYITLGDCFVGDTIRSFKIKHLLESTQRCVFLRFTGCDCHADWHIFTFYGSSPRGGEECSATLNVIYEFEGSENGIITRRNGSILTSYEFNGTFKQNTTDVRLFSIQSGTWAPYASLIRIYSVELTGDSMKMELIPVRKGGVGYMYDKVSGKLFGNAGTGAFTWAEKT